MFERFGEPARRVMVLAQEEARLLGHPFIGTQHLLLGVLREGRSVGAVALERLGVTLDAARNEVEDLPERQGAEPVGAPPFTPSARKVLEDARQEALSLGSDQVGSEHVLLGIVRDGEGVGVGVLRTLGSDPETVRDTVVQLISEDPGVPARAPDRVELPAVAAGPSWASLAGSGSPPHCPHCRSPLEVTARSRRLEPPDESGQPGGAFAVVYCAQCGRALAFRPVD